MKKIFSKHLYKEALRQGLAIGIIFTALFLLVSVIQCISVFSDIQMAEKITDYDRILTVDGSNFNMLYMLAFYVMTPLLIFNAFNFLTQRSRSDFYHSVPHTRICLYFSMLAGALTWMLIAIVVPALFSLPMYYLMSAASSFLYVNLSSILLLLFNTIAACLVTAGVATIAVSITGMYFPCVIVFGLILFLPKVLLFIFTYQICSFLPFMTFHSFGIFGSLQYSIPADILISTFTSNDISWWYSHVGAGIYSLCFGILLMSIGLLLFQKRKSEAAGQSAPSNVLQHIYRTAVGLAVSLLPLMLLINDGFSLAIIFLYGLAVIACFAYELITTRKLRNLKRATVSLAALVLLNIMIFVGIFASCQILKNKKIEVSGFRNSEQLVEISTDTPTYESLMVQDIIIDDLAICKMVEDAYNRTVANGYYTSPSYNQYYYSDIQLISQTGRKFYRKIAFTEEEYAKIITYLSSNQNYKENYMKMPQAPESFTVSCVGNKEYDQKIYESLLNEVKSFSFEQRQSLLGMNNMQKVAPEKQEYAQNIVSFINSPYMPIYVSGSLGTVSYQSKYMASPSLTPDTYRLILFFFFIKTQDEVKKFFQQFNSYTSFSLTLTLTNTAGNGQKFLSLDKYEDGSASIYCNDEEDFTSKSVILKDIEIQNLFSRLNNAIEKQGEFDLNLPILEVGINAYSYEAPDSVNTNYYINITMEEFETLKQEILSKT